MKCRILKPLKANGEKELLPGDIVDVPKDLAIKYIEKGKIVPTAKVAYRIYSNILQAYLWVVADDKDIHSLRGQGASEAIYTVEEVKELRKLSKEDIKEIHRVKETFPESTIKEIKRHDE